MSPDEVINEVRRIARSQPDLCEPRFSAACDMWWRVTIHCDHGGCAGESSGAGDISTAFREVLASYKAGHA